MFARDLDDGELDAAVATWRAEGWARIPGVVGEATLAALRDRSDAIVRGEVQIPGLFFQPDATTGSYADVRFGQGYEGPDRPYRKIEKLERDPLFRAWIENALFQRIVARVIPGPVVIYRAVQFAKAARTGSDLPWHQDGGRFWGLDRDPELQLWTALDDAPIEAGCLEVLPASHLDGLASPLGGIVQAETVRARQADARAVTVPARAGDVLLLHNLLWHRSGPNTSPAPRRAFTVCYMSAATRCLRKRHAPRVFVPVFTDPRFARPQIDR